MIEWWIDIPNLQTVDLPNSFEYVQSKSITSIYMNMNEWIDVSLKLTNLLPATYNCGYIESIESNVTSIHLPDRTCNDSNYTIFDISRFTILEELIIGNNCFSNVDLFNIDGLNELKSLKIGHNSFTNLKSYDRWDREKANNTNRSCGILNCVELESIEIGRFSFSDYGGGFELKNLPKLSTIKIAVLVIMEVDLNWRIFLNYQQSKLERLELIHIISIILHLW